MPILNALDSLAQRQSYHGHTTHTRQHEAARGSAWQHDTPPHDLFSVGVCERVPHGARQRTRRDT
eukprot:CAMPEP_0181223546 /NCGR_PEP_ID=MMETSP1096-20121128/30605_1 /TAXON_ID=156174 ORGANISM="Chrysochromulina ericina, Strain CCMP281" /NCGR_SAMPLE_ID=MMETSP1096 /ASSEMBLY_ACC=CAM_ASM_000453 /LENGTH=64 /DNA_ID=CAMNT_0023316477 /DNA_START=45 /DNA_END=239 /DNA_ORIENTATION=+